MTKAAATDQEFEERLQNVQQALNAPKTENNDFGGYKYRNIEKINEALKPLLAQTNLRIKYSDEVVFIGERHYVKATATITDGVNSESAVGYAREEYEKKKTDAAQLTGGASTYARKYAISGLLAIDDGNSDPDSQDNDREQYSKPAAPKASTAAPASPSQKNYIIQLAPEEAKADAAAWIEKTYDIVAKEMTSSEASEIIKELKGE